MRIHVHQVAYGDQEPMAERIQRVAEHVLATAGSADLVVLPELWAAGGFAYRQWRDRSEVMDPVAANAADQGARGFLATMSDVARQAGVVLHAGSFVERAHEGADRGPQGRGLWNTSVLFGPDGAVLASYRKIHRFGFGQGEPALMEAGQSVVSSDIPLPDGGTRVGLATCYDLRFPELFRALVDHDVALVLVPAAWPAARVEAWQLLGRARAMENQVVVVQCNTAGTHSGVVMGGFSQVVDATGAVLAQAGAGEEVLRVDVDLAQVDSWRRDFPVLADRRL